MLFFHIRGELSHYQFLGCQWVKIKYKQGGRLNSHEPVEAKTPGQGLGRGRGVFLFPTFFVSIFVVILLYCYFRMFGIFPSFMMEISQINKEHSETLSLFFEIARELQETLKTR